MAGKTGSVSCVAGNADPLLYTGAFHSAGSEAGRTHIRKQT